MSFIIQIELEFLLVFYEVSYFYNAETIVLFEISRNAYFVYGVRSQYLHLQNFFLRIFLIFVSLFHFPA